MHSRSISPRGPAADPRAESLRSGSLQARELDFRRRRWRRRSTGTRSLVPRENGARGPLLCLVLLLGQAVAGLSPAAAVTVILRGDQPPVRGYLVRETPVHVVVAVGPAEKRRELTFLRDEVQLVIKPVSTERLEALSPDNPQAYRDYAEELAGKQVDPEARDAAIRLYLIAARLAPDKFGRGAMLALVRLARTDAERRAFQALSFVLDPRHDASALSPSGSESGAVDGAPAAEGAAEALAALRLLRNSRPQEALQAANLGNARAAFDRIADRMSFAEFQARCTTKCDECEAGKVVCPRCKGTGRLGGRVPCACQRDASLTLCSACQGTGWPRNRQWLAEIARAELALLGGSPGDARPAPASRSRGWDAELREQQPLPLLDLNTVTEFDPRKDRYRDGEWHR